MHLVICFIQVLKEGNTVLCQLLSFNVHQLATFWLIAEICKWKCGWNKLGCSRRASQLLGVWLKKTNRVLEWRQEREKSFEFSYWQWKWTNWRRMWWMGTILSTSLTAVLIKTKSPRRENPRAPIPHSIHYWVGFQVDQINLTQGKNTDKTARTEKHPNQSFLSIPFLEKREIRNLRNFFPSSSASLGKFLMFSPIFFIRYVSYGSVVSKHRKVCTQLLSPIRIYIHTAPRVFLFLHFHW